MPRTDVLREIITAALQHDGAVSAQLLEQRGVSASSTRRRVVMGDLRRVHRGIYVAPTVENEMTALAAASLAYPAGAICRYSAASLHGFSVTDPVEPQFVVPHGTSTSVDGVRMYETRSLPDVDVASVDAHRTTTPARTICDIAGTTGAKRLRHIVEEQLVRRAPTDGDLIACVGERLRRGVPGVRALAELLGDILDDQPVPESALEMQLFAGLREIGLSDIRRQFTPPWYEGVRGIVDMADPRSRTIIEADGRRFRQVTQAHDNDRARDRMAAAAGWLVIRVGYHELQNRRRSVLDGIADVVRHRRRTVEAAEAA